MNDHLTIIELMSVTIMVLQLLVAFVALLAYGYVSNKKSWRWFVLAVTFIAIRRLLFILTEISGIQYRILELSVMILVSFLLLAYVSTVVLSVMRGRKNGK